MALNLIMCGQNIRVPCFRHFNSTVSIVYGDIGVYIPGFKSALPGIAAEDKCILMMAYAGGEC